MEKKELYKNLKRFSNDQSLPIEEKVMDGKQNWQLVRYDVKKKKWICRPVFFVRYRYEKKFVRISIKDALPLIGSFFPVTDDLKEWISTSKYTDELSKFL